MQQLNSQVYIEDSYPGVTVGAVMSNCQLILIDAPLRPEDGRHWKHTMMSIYGGKERLVVALNNHPDRTLGIKLMDCQMVGHDRLINVYRNRQQFFKPPNVDSGSDWEQFGNLGTLRWNPPDITFTENLRLYCGDTYVNLEHHAGPTRCSIWAILPEQKIVFVGDTVSTRKPPFLSGAKLNEWLRSLHLLSTEYKEYTIISGRQGVVTQADVTAMIAFLENVQHRLRALPKVNRNDEINQLAGEYLKGYNVTSEFQSLYTRRLTYGLNQCYQHNFLNPEADFDEF